MMQSRGVFAWLGRLAVRRRWWLVAAWAVLLPATGILAVQLPSRLAFGGFEVPGSQSAAVQRDLTQRFPGQVPESAVVVVGHPRLTVAQPAYAAALDAIAARVGAVPGVAGVQSWRTTGAPSFVAPDRRTTYLVVGLAGGQNESMSAAPAVAAAAHAAAPPGFDVATGGAPAMWHRYNEIGKVDLERAERVSLPLSLLALLLAFGGLVAAGLPLLLALAGLVTAMGGLYLLAGFTDLNIFVTNTASIIGIGVGIDYALFIVTRFREELRAGHPVADAVPRALASAGRAVALSGATVIVALAGMFLVDIQAVRSMAVGAMLAVALVVLAALTLLPAVLALLGGRVDRLHLPRLGRARPGAGGFWHHWAVTIMRRPWTFLLASLVILAVLTAPVTSVRLGQSGAASLPGGEGPRVALERLTAAFGAGVVGPIQIVVDTPGGATAPANLERIGRLTELLRADPAVAQVASLATLPPAALAAGVDRMDPRLRVAAAGLANWERGADLARVTVISRDRPESRAAEDLVERVRERYLPAAGLAGRAWVGGATALDVDMTAELLRRLPLVVVAVLALSFLLLASAFRSLLLPLKAVAMNLLSVGATLGLLVAVFQWGWGQHLLGFTSEGHLDQLTPLFLFCILFGLSMDYEVFLLSRVREEYQRTGSNELGVARGLEATARTITAAALIMVTVFGAFGAGRLVTLKQVGLGLAAAVFIDATVVRVVLVPAAMKLMGHWNWWLPAWLDRWLPRVEPEPSEPGAGGHRPAPDTLVGAHPAAPLGREP